MLNPLSGRARVVVSGLFTSRHDVQMWWSA